MEGGNEGDSTGDCRNGRRRRTGEMKKEEGVGCGAVGLGGGRNNR